MSEAQKKFFESFEEKGKNMTDDQIAYMTGYMAGAADKALNKESGSDKEESEEEAG